METIRDKLVLFLCCSAFVFWEGSSISGIAALFIGLIVGCLQEYWTKQMPIGLLTAGYIVAMVFYPQLLIFYPIIAYRWFYMHKWIASIVGALVFVMSLYGWNLLFTIILCGICLISLVMAYSTRQYQTLATEYKRQRDDSRELEMLLKNKNKDLMEKQDYEIYLATLRERNRIAREIHDNVGHMLSRSILQVGALCTIEQQQPMKGQLDDLQGTLNEAMNSIRNSVHNLYDESLDLRRSIEQTLREYTQYKIELDYTLSTHTPKEIKYCFMAVIKEALTNVVKHSDANRIRLILQEHKAFYQLLFEDNGSYYDKKVHTGIGLDNMKERVEAFHGVMSIQTEQGFKIFISIPKTGGHK